MAETLFALDAETEMGIGLSKKYKVQKREPRMSAETRFPKTKISQRSLKAYFVVI